MKRAKRQVGITKRNFVHQSNNFGKILTVAVLFLAVVNASAIQLTDLYDFTLADWGPGPLILSGNILYGTSPTGNTNQNAAGADGTGAIWRLNTDGTGFQELYSFSADPFGTNSDGANLFGGVVLSSSNTLYGVAFIGGASGLGTIFSINTNRTGFINLHNFSGADGNGPYGKLLLSSNTLYGTTVFGGDHGLSGTVFKINNDGTGFTNLHNFTSIGDSNTNIDGFEPYAGLVLSSNVLYGTASGGGLGGGDINFGSGTIFKINTDGTSFQVLHHFSAALLSGPSIYTNNEGAAPQEIILAGNALYGVTVNAGAYGNGTLFRINTDGTGFTKLHDFDGIEPSDKILLSGDVIYGVASGTIYRINTNGTGFINLYDNSSNAVIDVVLSGQTFYGTGSYGTNGWGMIFSLGPSQPIINSIVLNTDGTVTISCSGDAGFAYLMQATTNLGLLASWQTVSTNTADTNGNWQFTDYSLTNTIYGCFTNLIYTNVDIDPGSTNQPILIGTNTWCGDVLATLTRFYRAATVP